MLVSRVTFALRNSDSTKCEGLLHSALQKVVTPRIAVEKFYRLSDTEYYRPLRRHFRNILDTENGTIVSWVR